MFSDYGTRDGTKISTKVLLLGKGFSYLAFRKSLFE